MHLGIDMDGIHLERPSALKSGAADRSLHFFFAEHIKGLVFHKMHFGKRHPDVPSPLHLSESILDSVPCSRDLSNYLKVIELH